MSRYIDAEWIRNIYADFEHYENRDDWTTPITNVLAVINDAPSIDIVRCKECKHCSKDRIKWSVKGEDGNWIDTKCNLCKRTKLEVNLDDFCSYGEREGE